MSSATQKPIVLFDIDYTLFDTGEFKKSGLTKFNLYEEVVKVLKDLQDKVILGIFSEGDTDFQKNKLHQTAIYPHFLKKYVHIVARKHDALEEVLKNYKDNKLFLVDDKLPVLHKAKELNSSIFTIWVKRGIWAENQAPIEGFEPDAQVDDLHGIIGIIEAQISKLKAQN